jgi:TolB protein
MANGEFTLIALLVLTVVAGCQTQPTGGQIAFSRLTGDYWQIWTMEPDGKEVKQITSSASDKRYPVWAKEGRKLFFRTNNSELFSFDLNAGKERRILASLGLSSRVVPSPDGSKLVVARLRSQLKDSGNLMLTMLDGGNNRVLTRDAGIQHDPSWSPDGTQIVYVSSHGYRTSELYTVGADGSNKRRLTNNKASDVLPVFSPDGKTIAYVSDATGSYEIWLMNTDGSSCRRITDSKGIDTRPCWSPNGDKIVFASNRTGQMQVWIMNSDGSSLKQLTMEQPSMDPVWRRK